MEHDKVVFPSVFLVLKTQKWHSANSSKTVIKLNYRLKAFLTK